MVTTLAGWKNSVVVNVVQKLPLQTYEKAYALVEDYLSGVGGWVPVDPENPTGDGAPLNGVSEETAALAIITNQFARIYSCDVTATVTLRANLGVNLPAGLDNNSVLAALEGVLNDWLETQTAGAKVTLNSVTSYAAAITPNGILPTSELVAINAATQVAKVIDPRAIALKYAREKYILDSTWCVSKVYTETNSDTVCIIEKYTSTTYLTRDTSATNYYVIKIDSKKYNLVSGSKLRYE